MNTIKNLNKNEQNLVKVQSQKLSTFIKDHKLENIDFLKVDIEGLN